MSDTATGRRTPRRRKADLYEQPRSLAKQILVFVLVGPGVAAAALVLMRLSVYSAGPEKLPLLAVPMYLVGAVPAALTALGARRLSRYGRVPYVVLTGLSGAAVSALTLGGPALLLGAPVGVASATALTSSFFGLTGALAAALLTLPRRVNAEAVGKVFE